jgi:hypothetical protein
MADKKEKKNTGKSMFTKAKEAIIGTPEQNATAAAEMKEQDKKNPDSVQAKINKATDYSGYKQGGMVKSPKNKSASSRADGCAVRGKTRA